MVQYLDTAQRHRHSSLFISWWKGFCPIGDSFILRRIARSLRWRNEHSELVPRWMTTSTTSASGNKIRTQEDDFVTNCGSASNMFGAFSARCNRSDFTSLVFLNRHQPCKKLDPATVLKYQIFASQRVGEIQTLTQPEEWRFVPCKKNPSYFATRSAIEEDAFPT